jgi:tRNA(Phe) wybutosine-synthesizing methylase Tyw3
MTEFLLALQDVVVPARYTAAEVLGFIAAAGVLVAGIGAVIVNVIVALRQGTKLDAALVKSDDLAAQVEKVHVLTNSNLQKVKEELATMIIQNHELQELVATLRAELVEKAEPGAAPESPLNS